MKQAIGLDKPLPAAGDSFMRTLRADHGRLSRVMREIDAQQARLQEAPESARPVLAEAMRYLLHYQHAFHHPREDCLFDRIATRAPQFGGEMRKLMREHRGGLRQAEKLVADLADATPAELRRRGGARLAQRLADYVARTREHMRSEEVVFYAQSERVLDDSDWKLLLIEGVPDDPVGNQALLEKDYPHLAARLFRNAGDVAGRSDTPREAGSAYDRARGAIHDGVEHLVELCGDLVQDGFAVARANFETLRTVRSPLELVSAAGKIGESSFRFAVRCLADPPRVASATASQVVAAWRPPRAGKSGSGTGA